ncbi:hypothetical protein J2W48_002387 [Flavobacterium piscis]|uniref:Uncharacterized protein n=1 Tax=Flavobacterium piscis TaxID=1114874 RepID=A0ABU1YA80_9FLAO|nr:hypothetical protein [Flavobacterium piscis]
MVLFGISHYDLVFIMVALMYGYIITTRKK